MLWQALDDKYIGMGGSLIRCVYTQSSTSFLRLLSALSQDWKLQMADREDAEGPIPLDDGPVEDEVLEDLDGDDVTFIFCSIFLAQIPPPRGKLVSHLRMLQVEISMLRSREEI